MGEESIHKLLVDSEPKNRKCASVWERERESARQQSIILENTYYLQLNISREKHILDIPSCYPILSVD